MHEHETIETYTILKGEGVATIEGETSPIHAYDSIYIDRGLKHTLVNTGNEDMHLMFVYAPKMIVDHWAAEKSGKLK